MTICTTILLCPSNYRPPATTQFCSPHCYPFLSLYPFHVLRILID